MSPDILRFVAPLSITGVCLALAGIAYAARVLRHKSWRRSFRLRPETRLRLPAAGTYHLSQDLLAGGEILRARGAPFVRDGTRCRVVDDQGSAVRLWAGLLPERLLSELTWFDRDDWMTHRSPRSEHLWSFRATRAGVHTVQLEERPPDPKDQVRMVVDRAIGFEVAGVVATISVGLMLIIWDVAS